MLPNEGTEKLVCASPSDQFSNQLGALFLFAYSRKFSLVGNFLCFLCLQLKSSHLIPTKPPLPQDAIFNYSQAAAERRRAERRAKHKEVEITKREWNDQRAKCQKLKEITVPSDEDPSLLPAWSDDDQSLDVDWSALSGWPTSSLH
jgi:hypothetical protein